MAGCTILSFGGLSDTSRPEPCCSIPTHIWWHYHSDCGNPEDDMSLKIQDDPRQPRFGRSWSTTSSSRRSSEFHQRCVLEIKDIFPTQLLIYMLEDVGSKSMSLGLKYGLHLMPKGQRKRDENDLWGPPRQTNIWKDKRVRPNPTRSVFSGSQCIDKRNINGINPREIAGGIPYINSTSRKPNILVILKLTICFF